MTTRATSIPRLGELLRTLLKAGGYRPRITELRLDKNLDDVAAEAGDRQGSLFELLEQIENVCANDLEDDCGHAWAEFLRTAWLRTRTAVQTLALQVDLGGLQPDPGRVLFIEHFAIPMLSGFVCLAAKIHAAPPLAALWENPFRCWAAFAAERTGVDEHVLLENLANEIDVDQRTIARWMAGEPVGKLSWPYAPKVAAAIGRSADPAEVRHLAGWLLLCCAFQSLPTALREDARSAALLRSQHPWALDTAIDAMRNAGLRSGEQAGRDDLPALLDRIDACFRTTPVHHDALRRQLDEFGQIIAAASPMLKAAWQTIHDWFSARQAALLGEEKHALQLYASCIDGAWWCTGRNQQVFLDEALKYAVGVGAKDAASAYWDKTFMLGLNNSPKRPLDEQQRHRIALAFEKYFHPRKARDRVPPRVEIKSFDDAFKLAHKHLSSPNQKTKYADGRSRRTPLMAAILEGSLDDVQRLVAAGADPNDFIPESGESPLSYAMRRACDRKDPSIMDYLLELDLAPATVNRAASTSRETPLKIAVEMANAQAVKRLLALGAKVDAACDHLPSVLCYAMSVFHTSLYPDDPAQQQAYFAGQTPADVHDAKDGVVFDVDLAARRRRLQAMAVNPRYQKIREAVLAYMIRPPQAYREVIRALVVGGANANIRYKVRPHDLARWTPTLFAAQVGDLAVFKTLVEHPGSHRGDPALTLQPPRELERFDALWVAIAYKRNAIVTYLLDREQGNPGTTT